MMEKVALSDEQWQDSQKNELWFWKSQFQEGNPDQIARNVYYLTKMEGHCSMIGDFLSKFDTNQLVIMDLGSGPNGILDVMTAKRKIAVDPLMDGFREIGFDVERTGIEAYNLKAEEIGEKFPSQVDIVLCLNSIDHHQDPELVIKNIHKVLKTDGDLILLTDLRPIELLDAYHKLPLTQGDILYWLRRWDFVMDQVFPHGFGNSIMQYCIHVKKRPQ
jgi:SAM-dependent methyltransferase